MTSSSTTTAGPSQKAQTASASGLRATSQAKSRLIVRLPDLGSARIPNPAPVAAPGTSLRGNESVGNSSIRTPGQTDNQESTASQAARFELTSKLQELPRKALEMVRQPKFWLACIVAVAVQIVLALIMTPADAGPEREKRAAASAKPWQKTAAEPPARIVVPAAPVNGNDERSDVMPSGASPMAPALPPETSNDGGALGSASLLDIDGDRSAAVRMAENRPLADDPGSSPARPSSEADGATLGGIAPFEPAVPAQDRGPRR